MCFKLWPLLLPDGCLLEKLTLKFGFGNRGKHSREDKSTQKLLAPGEDTAGSLHRIQPPTSFNAEAKGGMQWAALGCTCNTQNVKTMQGALSKR
jgi:hypothetical protein